MPFSTNRMKVILLQDVPKIGKKYEVKEVSSGYAANFLIPKKLAEIATKKEMTRVELLKQATRMQQEIHTNLLYKNLHDVEGKEVHIKAVANKEGGLFKSIHTKDISDALKAEYQISLNPDYIQLEKPIKDTGAHDVVIDIEKKKATIRVIVEAK